MRYKKFEEKVKAWGEKYGYETEVEIELRYVCVKTNSGTDFQTIAEIGMDSKLILDTDWRLFENIEKGARAELFSIIVKLAKTPIEEREDEKRFIIPLPHLVTTDGRRQYLTYKDGNFFASRRDKTLKQTWKNLNLVPYVHRQFAVEFDEEKID